MKARAHVDVCAFRHVTKETAVRKMAVVSRARRRHLGAGEKRFLLLSDSVRTSRPAVSPSNKGLMPHPDHLPQAEFTRGPARARTFPFSPSSLQHVRHPRFKHGNEKKHC